MHMAVDLDELRRSRAAAWRKAVLPYIRDMSRSGFPAVIVLAVLVGLSGYSAFLEDVPPDFPVAAVGAVLLTPLLWRSPLRTYFQPADAVFLMPREYGMEKYMRGARRSGYIAGSAMLLAGWLLYAPLYTRGGAPAGAAVYVPAVLLVLKAAGDVCAWQERRVVNAVFRRLCGLLRAALTFAVVCALLSRPLPAALLFAAAAAALMAAVCRLPDKHRFPWQRLLDEEARIRRRYERFFRSFADLPTEAGIVSRRPYAGWIAGQIRHSRRNAYLLLYVLTLIRSELGGMLLRLTAVGMLFGWLAGSSGEWGGWAGAAAAWLFSAAAGAQAGTVRHVHRYAVWRHLYPLTDTERQRAAVRAAAAAHIVCALPIGLAAGLPAMIGGLYPSAAAALAGALALVPVLALRMRRNMKREEADDE